VSSNTTIFCCFCESSELGPELLLLLALLLLLWPITWKSERAAGTPLLFECGERTNDMFWYGFGGGGLKKKIRHSHFAVIRC
jgi:hypothetical protein